MKAAEKAIVGTFLCFVAVVWASPAAALEAPLPSRILPLLHDGRFDEADRVLAATPDNPYDLEVAFFRAFVTYWRLLYDDRNPTLEEKLAGQLEIAIEIAEARLDDDPDDVGARAWEGSSRLLRAQLYAKERKVLKAAYEAKRAKRALESSIELGANPPDAYFGLGTFNYYASQIPAILKGLRFLLALPGGNRELGLQQLETAAEESRYFALEARIILTSIYSSRHERDFVRALDEVDRALAIKPHTVAVLHAASVLDLSLSRTEDALTKLGQAAARASAQSGTASSVVDVIRYHRARAQLQRLRPDLTLLELQPLLADPDAVSVSLRPQVLELARKVTRWTAVPEWLGPSLRASEEARDAESVVAFRQALARAADGLEAENLGEMGLSVELLVALAERRPDDPAQALLAGRALLRVGRGAEALEWLSRAADSETLPARWLGPCRLMAGQAADLAGDRDRALEYYERVKKGDRFLGRSAAYLYTATPFSGDVYQTGVLGTP